MESYSTSDSSDFLLAVVGLTNSTTEAVGPIYVWWVKAIDIDVVARSELAATRDVVVRYDLLHLAITAIHQ